MHLIFNILGKIGVELQSNVVSWILENLKDIGLELTTLDIDKLKASI